MVTLLEVVHHDNKKGLIPKQIVRKMLGNLSRPCLIRDYKCLDLGNQTHFTWGEIKQLYALRLFLQHRIGVHSRAQYTLLLLNYTPEEILAYFGINLDQQFRRLQNQWIYKI